MRGAMSKLRNGDVRILVAKRKRSRAIMASPLGARPSAHASDEGEESPSLSARRTALSVAVLIALMAAEDGFESARR